MPSADARGERLAQEHGRSPATVHVVGIRDFLVGPNPTRRVLSRPQIEGATLTRVGGELADFLEALAREHAINLPTPRWIFLARHLDREPHCPFVVPRHFPSIAMRS